MILDDAVPAAMVSRSRESRRLPAVPKLVLLDRDDAEIARRPDARPHVEVDPDSPVYVIYTSGSTGRPNGVVVTHHQVARLFTAAREHFDFDAGDVWSQFHSFAFDFSVWELWGALCHGGRLVTVPVATRRDPAAFLDLLECQRVTVLNQTPSAFRALLGAIEAYPPRRLALSWIVFGGEALEIAGLRPWLDRYGDGGPG